MRTVIILGLSIILGLLIVERTYADMPIVTICDSSGHCEMMIIMDK